MSRLRQQVETSKTKSGDSDGEHIVAGLRPVLAASPTGAVVNSPLIPVLQSRDEVRRLRGTPYKHPLAIPIREDQLAALEIQKRGQENPTGHGMFQRHSRRSDTPVPAHRDTGLRLSVNPAAIIDLMPNQSSSAAATDRQEERRPTIMSFDEQLEAFMQVEREARMDVNNYHGFFDASAAQSERALARPQSLGVAAINNGMEHQVASAGSHVPVRQPLFIPPKF